MEKAGLHCVDAYFPLATDETPEVSSIKKEWRKHSNLFEKISTEQNRPVLFTKYGYRNVDNTTAKPWKENEGDQNDEAQANAYEAFYQSFAGKKWFAGGFVWKWYVDDSHHGRQKINFTPQKHVAENIIASWYKVIGITLKIIKFKIYGIN